MEIVESSARVGSRPYIGLEVFEKKRRGQSGISGKLADGMVDLFVGRWSDTMIAFDIHCGGKILKKRDRF
jgi:hypothetical protein